MRIPFHRPSLELARRDFKWKKLPTKTIFPKLSNALRANLLPDCVTDFLAPTFERGSVPAFDQQTRFRLRARITQQHPAAGRVSLRPPLLDHQLQDAVQFLETAFSRARAHWSPVADIASSNGRVWTAVCLVGFHDAQEFATRHTSPSPGGAVIAENHVAALLAAEVESIAQHFIYHVFVAHRRANHCAAGGADECLQSGVAHHRGHHRFFAPAFPASIMSKRGDGHDVVAINHVPVLIAKQYAVGVAIMRDADVAPGVPGLSGTSVPDASSRNPG